MGELASDYRFFRNSASNRWHLAQLARAVHRDAPELFEFLCLGQSKARSEVERWVGPEACADAIAREVIYEGEEGLRAMVRLVPVRDGCYAADAPAVLAKGRAYGLKPSHVSQQTHRFLRLVLSIARRRRAGSLLEMGCGIGMVCLELRERIPTRVGVDINDRDVRFAEVNRLLSDDAGCSFAQSDLFSAVSGQFDAIIFHPWLPSHPHLDTVARFLAQTPRHLNDDAYVALMLSTEEPGAAAADPTLRLVTDFSRSNQFSVTQFVTESWLDADRRRVSLNSCFLFERDRKKQTMRRSAGGAFLGKTIRLTIASSRGLFP